MTRTTERAHTDGRFTSATWFRVIALIAALFTALAGSMMLATTASADAGGTPNDHASSAPGHSTATTPPEVNPGTPVDTDHPDNGKGNDATKDQSPGNSGFHKVSICHYTGNAGWIVITMSEQAWAAHDKHQGSKDDFVTTTGSCAGAPPTLYSGCYLNGSTWSYLTDQSTSPTKAGSSLADCTGTTPTLYSGCYLNGSTWSYLTDQSTAPTKAGSSLADCTGGGTTTAGGTPGAAATGVTPLPATVEEATAVTPQAATVIPPKAARAGDGSSVPGTPTAAWILLLTGALGVVGAGTRLVTAR